MQWKWERGKQRSEAVVVCESGWQYKFCLSKLGQLMIWRITELAYQHSVLEIHARSLWLLYFGLAWIALNWVQCEENRLCDNIAHVESFSKINPNLKTNHSFESVHFMNGSNGLATIQFLRVIHTFKYIWHMKVEEKWKKKWSAIKDWHFCQKQC